MKKGINLSINQFLLVGILSFTVLYFASIYTLSQRQAIHEIEELFDAQLAHSSYILMNLLSESVSTIDQESAHLPVVYFGFDAQSLESNHALFYQKKVAYQIFNANNKLLITSGSAPEIRLADKHAGYSNIDIQGERWRVYSLYDDDWDFWLHVAESVSIRQELSNQIARQTLWPGLALLPIALLLLTLIIRLGLKPLKQLTLNINKRDPKNLTQITLFHTPKEMKPVVDALNILFHRLNDAIAREKRLTADAAHELRTPLAVVMLHAQNAIAATNNTDRDLSLQELEIGVKRVSRLLEQLLTLSKVSPETIPVDTVVLYPLCQEVMAQLALSILDKQQELEMTCDSATQTQAIMGSHFLLEILLRNLIDNASEYTPKKGMIRLSILNNSKYLELIVEDSGKGVMPENYGILTNRFYREKQQVGKGAGLGLSLVNSIVEFHNGELIFSKSALGGLAVTVRLPKPD
ncbi:ATP-binding protein [Oceaniserpentilla sp. 4NH20-0058]|uniref:ATP-binding protein n=1 Tax=Oceaniserpentilla sp. 4NH20-0058 TaxID=3127660 RepID=UPI00333FC6AD